MSDRPVENRGIEQTDAIVEIAKDFHWEMGHRLPFHEGGCRNLHGHSYRMRLVVAGYPDANGMVVDYFEMRRIIAPFVEELDHAFLCDRSDTVVLTFLQDNDMKHVVVDFPSTAENIATWMLEEVARRLAAQTNLTRIAVRLHETERTYAEASRTILPVASESNKPDDTVGEGECRG